AVDIGVGHEHDVVVAKLRDVEASALLLAADAATERRDQCPDLRGRQHLVETSTLDVQDLAAEGEDRLELPVAALLRRATGAVSLDDVDLARLRIATLTVGELAGEARVVHRALPDDLARLPCRLASLCRQDRLLDDLPRSRRVLLEEATELLG